MERILLSEEIRQEISYLLSEKIRGDADILKDLMARTLKRALQEDMEQEMTDHLGRDHYEPRR